MQGTVQSMKNHVSTTEKYCFHFALFYLQIINIVDFLLGGMFLAFTLYLAASLGEHYLEIQVAWLEFFCLIEGILLLITAALSFLAISSTNCRSMAYPTDAFALLITLIDIGVGIAASKLQSVIIAYISDHGEELGLSQSNIDTVKNWFVVIVIAFFASAIFELLRIWLNRGFAHTSRRIDMEYSTLLDDEERAWEEKMQKAQQTTQEKYRKLKQFYHDKYKKPLPNQENAEKYHYADL